MVKVSLKLPSDLNWILESEEDLKFFESVLVHKLCETKLGDLLAEKSELKEEVIDEIDHLVKEGLFKRVKGIE